MTNDSPSRDDFNRLPLMFAAEDVPLLQGIDGVRISREEFQARVVAFAARLPEARHAINLCESRGCFIIALCAAALRGQVTLLPPSRAEDVIDGARKRYPQTCVIGDAGTTLPVDVRIDLQEQFIDAAPPCALPTIAPDTEFVIGFTSGSTGVPTAYPKTLRSFMLTTAANMAGMQHLLPAGAHFNIVATVPPQHMYGMELSVMLPLLAAATVHAARPFFPQDIANTLASMPEPRLLVTTPLHLRALVESGIALPALSGIVTATAPLPRELAATAEQRFHCEVLEMFGATETCVIATRRTACEDAWTLLPEVALTPQDDGTLVQRPSLSKPIALADSVELSGDGAQFILRGRQADMLEIAGKRASLADLTHKLQEVRGIRDGVMAQLPEADAQGLRRLVAIIVADEQVQDADILTALRRVTDPVFLPRRVIRLEALPRNETGKIPRSGLDAIITTVCTRASSN